jgi:polyisoprenoid-binding protein YceI
MDSQQNALNSLADPDPRKIRAGRYLIDPKHTRLLFHVSHFGFTRYWGEFIDPQGELVLDPANVGTTDLSVRVAMANIMTNSSILTDELKSRDWFDAERFPTMQLRATEVWKNGANGVAIKAELTLKGVTAPIDLHALYNAGGINPKHHTYTIGFEGRGSLKRSVFGVTAALPVIGDDVEIVISASFDLENENIK